MVICLCFDELVWCGLWFAVNCGDLLYACVVGLCRLCLLVCFCCCMFAVRFFLWFMCLFLLFALPLVYCYLPGTWVLLGWFCRVLLWLILLLVCVCFAVDCGLVVVC